MCFMVFGAHPRSRPTCGIRACHLRLPVGALTLLPFPTGRCFNEADCISVPPVDGCVMVLQPEEPKISLSGVHHFARAASEFESSEGVFLFPELRIISTITREVEPDGEGDEDPTGDSPCAGGGGDPAAHRALRLRGSGGVGACCCSGCAIRRGQSAFWLGEPTWRGLRCP